MERTLRRVNSRVNLYARRAAAAGAVATALFAPFAMHLADERAQADAKAVVAANDAPLAYNEGRASLLNEIVADTAYGVDCIIVAAGVTTFVRRRQGESDGAARAIVAAGALGAAVITQFGMQQVVSRDEAALSSANTRPAIIEAQQTLSTDENLLRLADGVGILLLTGLTVGAVTSLFAGEAEVAPPAPTTGETS